MTNERDYIGHDKRFSFSYEHAPLAFGFDKFGGGLLNDPRYFKWIARMNIMLGDEFKYVYLPTKPCDDETYEGFYDAAATSKINIEKFKKGKALTCVDLQGEEIDIYGTWVLNADYAALDMMAVPCGT